MSDKKNTLTVGGHTVQVVDIGGTPRLLVDGLRRHYVCAPNGYTLREAIYEEPAPTLLEAGKALAKSLAAIEGAVSNKGD